MLHPKTANMVWSFIFQYEKIIICLEITFANLEIFFNMYIVSFILTFIAAQKVEDSI